MLLGYKFNVISTLTMPSWKTTPSSHDCLSVIDVYSAGRLRVGRRQNTGLNCSLGDSNSKLNREEMIAKLRTRLFHREVEISPSSYDTAWVAMVPARDSSSMPCFPQCLDWIMENQNPDGGWGLHYPAHPLLLKDSLSCTLACLLALRKWNVGHQLLERGLQFIGRHGWVTSDKAQYTPIGFEIVFPKMIHYANELNLNLPLDPVAVENMIKLRDSAIRRNQNLEYVAEGLGDPWNWKQTISSWQRSNGSLFNSPATTAAALIHGHDDKCFQYLLSVLTDFSSASVPTMYPLDIYTSLCIVDTLERLGVDRHFRFEIHNILEKIYRLWQRKEEQLFTDITCRAMAFRFLRTHEYPVSSDELAEFVDQEHFLGTVSLQFTGATTILELNRASQLQIHEGEVVLEMIHAWTSTFLKLQLQKGTILDNQLAKQVENALKNTKCDRLESKSSIELYNVHSFQILKTTYRCHTIANEDILQLSRQDFNICQAQYQRELTQLERWYVDIGLNKCNFGKELVHVSYLTAAAITPDPNLSDVRMCLAHTCVLVSKVDDFIDSHASDTDALHFVERVKKWSLKDTESSSCPEVETLFTALYKGVDMMAENASIKQGRCVKQTLKDLWRELIMYYMKQRSFSSEHRVISLDEYLSVTWVTIAFKVIVHSSAHFLDVKISEDLWTDAEYTNLCKHASTLVRILNDLQSYQREKPEENSVGQLIAQSNGTISEVEAVSRLTKIAEKKKAELLQMVFATKGSLFPKEYMDLFWKTCKYSYYLYSDEDGFSMTKKVIRDMNALIYQPIIGPPDSAH